MVFIEHLAEGNGNGCTCPVITVTILGFGPIGHALCALLGQKPGIRTVVWHRSGKNRRDITITGLTGKTPACSGTAHIEPDLETACKTADVIVMAMPSFASASLLPDVVRFVRSCSLILAWEGTGWSLPAARTQVPPGQTVAGLQKSPIVARVIEREEKVEFLGVRTAVVAGLLQGTDPDKDKARTILEALLPCRFNIAPSYDHITVSPGNPVFHPARIFSHAQSIGPRGLQPASFYGGWTDSASECLLALHGELVEIRNRLTLQTASISTLLDRSPKPDARQITRETSTPEQLHFLPIPVKTVGDTMQWDIGHRFFTEDIGEGLVAISRTGAHAGVETPATDAIIAWHDSLRERERASS